MSCFLLVAFAGVVEGPADAALAAFAGVDGGLHGDFVGRALLEEPAHAAVQVFGVLADDDEVDVVGALAGQRRFHAGEQLHRPEVDVLIEAEAQFQEQALFQDARGHVGMADGAQQDGAVAAQLVQRGGRQDFAGLQVAVAAEVEVVQFVADAFQLGHGLEDLHAFGRHFRPGAVAADHGNLEDVVAGHDGAPVSARAGVRPDNRRNPAIVNGLRSDSSRPPGPRQERRSRAGRRRVAAFRPLSSC